MSPTTQFTLDINDIDYIESSLNLRLKELSIASLSESGDRIDELAIEMKNINNLLAKLYHQKSWYRPANTLYVGG
jgi:hypothetical protein